MKFNSVVTNIEQDFTESEKALGRKNIDAGGIAKYEIDDVEQWSGDVVLGKKTGSSMREIGVKIRDALSGDSKVGYLVPPRTFKGMNLVNDISGNITWAVQPPVLSPGQYVYFDDQYRINVSGLQPSGNYITEADISGLHNYSGGDYIEITDDNVINVTGLPTYEDVESATSGKLDESAYVEPLQSDWNQTDTESLDYIKNKPTIPSLDGYATEEYVQSAVSGKLDASAYVEPVQSDWNQSNTTYLDYIKNKPTAIGIKAGTGIVIVDETSAIKISCSATGGSTYTPGDYIEITDDDVINVTGLPTYEDIDSVTSGKADLSDIYDLSAGQNISIVESGDGYVINVTGLDTAYITYSQNSQGGTTEFACDKLDINQDSHAVKMHDPDSDVDVNLGFIAPHIETPADSDKVLVLGSGSTGTSWRDFREPTTMKSYLPRMTEVGVNDTILMPSLDLPAENGKYPSKVIGKADVVIDSEGTDNSMFSICMTSGYHTTSSSLPWDPVAAERNCNFTGLFNDNVHLNSVSFMFDTDGTDLESTGLRYLTLKGLSSSTYSFKNIQLMCFY